jgi:hypothetical protein
LLDERRRVGSEEVKIDLVTWWTVGMLTKLALSHHQHDPNVNKEEGALTVDETATVD